jgi:SAM-dependent methyltransferase
LISDDQAQLIIKHLPPSASVLRLLDLDGLSAEKLAQRRQDLEIRSINGAADHWQFAPNSFDAVVVYQQPGSPDLLAAVLAVLRPGGRLIFLDAHARIREQQVHMLESAGYTRTLVESLGEEGVLLRGEKPHRHTRTTERILVAAAADRALITPYLHLLVRQSPNKPVWALHPDEKIEWQALALEKAEGVALLVFSSLPKAVAFMQPAVMQGLVRDINKVAKFRRETAQGWPLPLILNPDIEILTAHALQFWPLDYSTAESGDE